MSLKELDERDRWAAERHELEMQIAALQGRVKEHEESLLAMHVHYPAVIGELKAVLEPLVAIADAFDGNGLDDEARKHWGPKLENTLTKSPDRIELYCGRGGKQLLTLGHCLRAREALRRGR